MGEILLGCMYVYIHMHAYSFRILDAKYLFRRRDQGRPGTLLAGLIVLLGCPTLHIKPTRVIQLKRGEKGRRPLTRSCLLWKSNEQSP